LEPNRHMFRNNVPEWSDLPPHAGAHAEGNTSQYVPDTGAGTIHKTVTHQSGTSSTGNRSRTLGGGL
jgi:hypothetical protein